MTIDFERARNRLAEQQRHLERGLGAEARRALLEERARRVASRSRRAEHRELLADVVAVRRGRELWGFPLGAVREVRKLALCALPGLGGVLQGLVHLRGEAVSVVDLGALTGIPTPSVHGEELLAVLVAGRPGTLAVRVDEVLGRRSVWSDECEGAGEGDRQHDFVAAMTRDLLAVIDVERLLARPEVSAVAESA
jgi:chemotaxis signal transduction protein